MSPYLQRHCQHQVPGSKNCFLGTYKVATFSSPGFAAMVDEWSPAGRGRLTTTRRLYANRKTGGRGTTRSRHRGAAQTTPSTERRRGLQSTQRRGGKEGQVTPSSFCKPSRSLARHYYATVPLWSRNTQEQGPAAQPTTSQPACSSALTSRAAGAYSCGAGSRQPMSAPGPRGAVYVPLEREFV